MTTKTLEQELGELIESSDYLVRFGHTSFLHVHLYYKPAMRFGKHCCLDTGEFAHKLFGGFRRYQRAAKWIRRTVREHQEMISSMGGVKLL